MKNHLLLLLGVLIALPSLARDFNYTYEGQTITYTVIDENAKTCTTKERSYANEPPGNDVSGDLILPVNPKDGDTEYTLTKIGVYAFSGCSNLTSVIIPNTVTLIGRHAFYQCSSLTSVVLGNSVETIGSSAFDGCNRLTSVKIPKSVTTIGYSTFYGCSGLTSIIIPDSVTLIGDYAFAKCSGLISVIIGNSVTSIGSYAFMDCSGLASVVIGTSAASIGSYAFKGCSGLIKSAYPNTIKNPFGEGVTISYPAKNTIIEDGFVYNRDKTAIYFVPLSLESEFTIPYSVKTIGDYAFYRCSGMTSVDIPNSVTSLGNGAFSSCYGVASVVIPNSVTSLGSGVFSGCYNLKKSAYPNTISNPFSSGICISYPAKDAMIMNGFVYGPDKSAIYFAPLSLEGEFVIPSSVQTIGESAFRDCNALTSVEIPNSVQTIGESAFKSCNALKSVEIPNSVKTIGESAFYNCSGLTSVVIGNSVTNIGKSAFFDCTGLTSVVIPNSVKTIGNYAFLGCSGLIKSAYPSTIENPFYNYGLSISYPAKSAIIEDGVVYGPNKTAIYFAPLYLEGDYVIPKSVTYIDMSAFRYCSGLTSVVIPDSVTGIDGYAFSDCTSLISVEIGNSVTEISYNAFFNCSSLTSVVIPNSVTSIYGSAFNGCTSLISVEIGNSVTEIGGSAFLGCSSLTSVVIPNSVTVIGAYAFGDCSNLTSIKVEDGEKTLTLKGLTFAGAEVDTVYMGRNWTNIGDEAISTGIKSITLGNQVTAIPKYAFRNCSSLTSVIIPSLVQTIGDYAFYGCSGLTSVEIPNSVTEIGNYAFYGCNNLTSVEIGNSVTIIGSSAFSGCSGLTSVEIPNSVQTIETRAFKDCNGLTGMSIPASVLVVGRDAFSSCGRLKILTIEDAETPIKLDDALVDISLDSLYIGRDWSCSYNSNDTLSKTVHIGRLVKSIPTGAFRRCKSLSNIEIGSSVASIGDNVFFGCSSLASIYLLNPLPAIIKDSTFDNSAYSNVTLHIPDNSLLDYLNSDWSKFINTVEGNNIVERYTDGVFNYRLIIDKDFPKAILTNGDYSSLNEVLIPERFTVGENTSNPTRYYLSAIGPNAFKNCINLKTLKFNSRSRISAIGAEAFSGCKNLTTVELPNTLITLGDKAFYDCWAIESIELPEKLDSIGAQVFSGYGRLNSISIPESVRSIGVNAFGLPLNRLSLKEVEYASIKSMCRIKYGNRYSNPISCLSSNGRLLVSGEEVTDILIPDEITGINDYAFYNAPINSVVISKSVTEIGDCAFSYCSGLKSVNIPNSVASIGNGAFSDCSGLASVVIPNSVKTIGKSAFSYCSGLTSVKIPGSVNTIGDNAFGSCYNLNDLVIEDGDTFISLGKTIFYSMGSRLYIGRDFTCSDSFISSRLRFVTIGDHVHSIPDKAFAQCQSLETVKMGNSIETIGDNAFAKCYYLNTVILSEALVSIGKSAFEGCNRLVKLTIPSGVVAVEENAFANCNGLTTLIFKDGESKIRFGSGFSSSSPVNDLYIGRDWSYADEKSITPLVEKLTIGDKVKSIPDNAFLDCEQLTRITIPDGVETIGRNAFTNCSNLKTISIGNNVKAIGSYVFSGCTQLSSITLPDIVETIGENAFSNCTNLASVEMGKQLCRIDSYTFNNCTALTSTTIPNTVKIIGEGAFYNCTGLTDMTIPCSVDSIGDLAYYNCEGIESLYILDYNNPIALGNDIFSSSKRSNEIKYLYLGRQLDLNKINLKSIQSLKIGNTVNHIQLSGSNNFPNLTSLTLGNSLKTIADNAFRGAKLTEVIIPPSVEAIGESAFANNSKLETIIMGHSVKTIGAKAFDGCPAPNVYITAQNPPSAPNNTFSSYMGNLYLQGIDALDKYYDAFTCWDRFDSFVMIEPDEMEFKGKKLINGKPGDTFQLMATLLPENVTLPQVFWRSTNTEIATVDANGLVTIHSAMSQTMAFTDEDDNNLNSCKIIAESLYADGPIVEISVTSSDITTDIDDIATYNDSDDNGDIDYDAPYEVYNFNGMFVGDSLDRLNPGIYIVRQGRVVKKIAIN